MRHISAILLLLVFSLGLATPFLASSGPESQLPACCRRDGKHRCAMMESRSKATAPKGPTFSTRAGYCPNYRHATPNIAGNLYVLLPALTALPHLTDSSSASLTESLHLLSTAPVFRMGRAPPAQA